MDARCCDHARPVYCLINESIGLRSIDSPGENGGWRMWSLLRIFLFLTILKKLHTLSHQQTVSKSDVRPILIATLILALIVTFACYFADLMATLMSFDGGRPGISIYIAAGVLALAPVFLQWLPLVMAWRNYRKGDCKRAVALLKINWWSVAIVVAGFALGLVIMFILLIPAMLQP